MASDQLGHSQPKVVDCAGVTILGGGPWQSGDLNAALHHAPCLVCADGAANHLGGRWPHAIIGDMDSVEDIEGWADRLADRLIQIDEQDSTDFEKCLRATMAPLTIGVGFLGGRLDHELAVLSTLVAHDRRIILISETDVVFVADRSLSIDVIAGDRVSIFPMCPISCGESEGLEWPLAGLNFAPGQHVGTSNRAAASKVSMQFDRRGALIILPRSRLDAAIHATRPETTV